MGGGGETLLTEECSIRTQSFTLTQVYLGSSTLHTKPLGCFHWLCSSQPDKKRQNTVMTDDLSLSFLSNIWTHTVFCLPFDSALSLVYITHLHLFNSSPFCSIYIYSPSSANPQHLLQNSHLYQETVKESKRNDCVFYTGTHHFLRLIFDSSIFRQG